MKKAERAVAEKFKEKLLTDDRWVAHAILAIYSRQDYQEQVSGRTLKQNGVGFSGVDGEFLSSLAEQLNNKKRLSEIQLLVARRKIVKYTRQLVEIAKQNKRIDI